MDFQVQPPPAPPVPASAELEALEAPPPPADRFIHVVDSPSNPLGALSFGRTADVWDAAYGSAAYGGVPELAPVHKIMVGSLAKTLGLTGLRIGWAATDDDTLAVLLGMYAAKSYNGVSLQDQALADHLLTALSSGGRMDAFERTAKGYLDDNRGEAPQPGPGPPPGPHGRGRRPPVGVSRPCGS